MRRSCLLPPYTNVRRSDTIPGIQLNRCERRPDRRKMHEAVNRFFLMGLDSSRAAANLTLHNDFGKPHSCDEARRSQRFEPGASRVSIGIVIARRASNGSRPNRDGKNAA